MDKKIAKVWTFTSDSNPNKQYETLQYTDSSTSCGCPGWTRRVAADGSRTCKHTRLIDQGQADSQCVSSHEYDAPAVQTIKTKAAAPKIKSGTAEKVSPARKILW